MRVYDSPVSAKKAREISEMTDLSVKEAMEVVENHYGGGDDELCAAVKAVFADTFTAYYRAHSAHWNVSGPAFGAYHDFFAGIYEDLYGAIDALAEHLQKLGDDAPSNIPALLSCGTISPAVDQGNDPRTLCVDLMEMNEMLLSSLMVAFHVASDADEQGLANFLADRIDASKKWAWQLRKSVSSL